VSELTQQTENFGVSALELLEQESLRTPIVTFNRALDTALGGGIQIGIDIRFFPSLVSLE